MSVVCTKKKLRPFTLEEVASRIADVRVYYKTKVRSKTFKLVGVYQKIFSDGTRSHIVQLEDFEGNLLERTFERFSELFQDAGVEEVVKLKPHPPEWFVGQVGKTFVDCDGDEFRIVAFSITKIIPQHAVSYTVTTTKADGCFMRSYSIEEFTEKFHVGVVDEE